MFIAALLPLAWILWRLFSDQLGAEPIEKVQQETGDWALRFLAISLAVTPLRRLSGWNELIKFRRLLGLYAFFYASLHLVNYIAVDNFFAFGDIVEDVAKHLYITVGMASFLLLLPLALTSTKGWIKRLGGKRWNRLHRLVYLAAIGGTVHYLWAVKKDITNPLIYAAVFALLLGYRAWLALGPRLRGARSAA
ncbi:MAG: protein-methionine-sulfoxide reductase heme-binding subunit MsrQ [Gemmatimonadaceae bacterium]